MSIDAHPAARAVALNSFLAAMPKQFVRVVSGLEKEMQTVPLAGANPICECAGRREMSVNGQKEPALELLEVLTRRSLSKEEGIRVLARALRLWALRNDERLM